MDLQAVSHRGKSAATNFSESAQDGQEVGVDGRRDAAKKIAERLSAKAEAEALSVIRRALPPRHMRSAEAAEYLAISTTTFLARVKAGALPPKSSITGRWSRDEIDAAMRAARSAVAR
jgi:predicted DNA-binding transcriptional regulator AlpA